MQDRILGAIALLIAIAMGVGAREYVAPISYEPIGPRAVPTLLAVLMGMVGLWMLVRGAPSAAPSARAADESEVASAPADSAAPMAATVETEKTPLLPPRVIVATLAIVIYALLFETLGFTLATALMTVPVARLFGGSWKQGIVTGLVMGFVMYLVFDRLLDVVLPAGLLKGLF